MTDDPDIAVVAQGALPRLKEMRRVLERGGMSAQIVAPPDAKLNT